jgi:hypothetical protein
MEKYHMFWGERKISAKVHNPYDISEKVGPVAY